MKTVVDRIVQFSNRYKLTNVETGEVLGTFDFDEVTGTVQQVGTEINAELFKNFAQIDGKYPSLMSGGVVAVQGEKSDDLDNFKGSAYYGKSYYWPGGNTPSNAPSGANGGLLLVQRCGGSTAAQIFITHRSTNGTTPPVVYQRSQTSTDAWSDWEEIVTSDGSYPNLGAGKDGDGNVITETYAKQTGSYPTLGAGYLAKRYDLKTDGVQQGWLKIGTVPFSTVARWYEYSCIMLVHGIFRGSSTDSEGKAPKTALIEIEGRRYANSLGDQRIGVLMGDVPKENLCFVIEENLDMSIYIYNDYVENIITAFEILSEGESLGSQPANIFQWNSNPVTALPSAPANAVYAVVRNNASADDNGYSFDTNYVWHNNGQAEVNTLKDGTTSLDFNDYLEEGKYELQGKADNPAVNFPTSSLNSSATNCDWYLVVYRRSPTYITQIAYSVRADNAISIRSRDNGEWREWRLLFEDGVAQSIPTASETVIGGAKIWRDSDGYLNIDTQ